MRISARVGVRGRVVLVLAVLSIGFLALVMRHDERVILIDSAGAFYASCSRALAMQTVGAYATGDSAQLRKQVELAVEGPGVQYAAVLRPTGQVVASAGNPTPGLEFSRVVAHVEGAEIRASKSGSMPSEFFVVYPIHSDVIPGGRIVLYVSSVTLANRLRGRDRWRPWGLASVALAAAIVALWADRHVSRSTRALLGATHALAGGNLEQRVNIVTGDMLERLGEDFNRMADRIQAGEEHLRQVNRELKAKVAELGLLASGLAHELNNPLAAVSAMAEDLTDQIAADAATREEIARQLRSVGDETARCRRLVRELLVYARPNGGSGERTTLRPVLEHVAYIARSARQSSNVQIELGISDELPEVIGGPDAYEQILLNLVSNAIDASPPGGVVRLAARCVESGVRIEVSDQGDGIPLELRERIFEPFFTTKPAGEGTGLGLAIVKRAVERLGGRVFPDPNRTPGATFVVEVPRA